MTQLFIMIALALLLDAVFGDPHGRFHPVALFGRAAGRVERFCRSAFGNGIASGFVGWSVLVFGAAAGAWGLVRFSEAVNPVLGLVVASGCVYLTVALRSLLEHAEAIRRPLRSGDLVAARRALSMIVSRDTATLGESEVVRGGIESLGENLTDAVASALFFAVLGYVLGGLPGAAAGAVFLRAVNTLDACWGYRDERYLRFGRVAARTDDVAHYLPARLTLAAVAVAAALCGMRPAAALKAGIRHRHDHPSPNSCWGMAGFAGALGIRLGGPTVYGGVAEPYPYWGNGRAGLKANDLLRAERLTALSALVFAALVAGIGGLCL